MQQKRHGSIVALLLFAFGLCVIAPFLLGKLPLPNNLPQLNIPLPKLDDQCHAPTPTLVLFTADWCGWCKKLKKEMAQNPRLKERLKRYAVTEIDVDANPEIAKKANLKEGIPETFYVDGRCRTRDRMVGYRPADEFLLWLDDVEN